MIQISKYLNKLKKGNYMINKNRAVECFWLFSKTLPIGKNQTDNLVKAVGENLAPYLPELFDKMSKVCLENPDNFEGYLELIKNMIDYIREDSDLNPIEFVDHVPEEYETFKKAMEIQIGKRSE